jgi:hypothetical protein
VWIAHLFVVKIPLREAVFNQNTLANCLLKQLTIGSKQPAIAKLIKN